MPKFTRPVFILILLSFAVSSCGVIFGGSRFSGSVIAKDHPKAKIYYNGTSIGQGTAIGLYPRNRPFTVELREEGCENKTITYNNTFRGGNFVLSLLTWGLTGIIVDLASGASYKPDHRGNPAIQKMSDKNFVFTADYSECESN